MMMMMMMDDNFDLGGVQFLGSAQSHRGLNGVGRQDEVRVLVQQSHPINFELVVGQVIGGHRYPSSFILVVKRSFKGNGKALHSS